MNISINKFTVPAILPYSSYNIVDKVVGILASKIDTINFRKYWLDGERPNVSDPKSE